MNESLLQKIRQCPTLPSLPAVALQVLELAQSEQVDIPKIAETISRDPALAVRILKTVNSSFYGRSHNISTINHALVILGLQSVKTLVLGFSLVTTLNQTKPKAFKHLTYWRHSIFAATAARLLAKKFQIVQVEEAFLAALLMDIGMLVLDGVLGEEYGAIFQQAAGHEKLAGLEDAALSLNHAQVAGDLAQAWKLLPILSEPMLHHHTPEALADPALQKIAQVISLASRCADVFVDEHPAESIAAIRKACQSLHQMDEKACDQLLEEIGRATKEVAPLFEVSLGNASYESILAKANQALVEMTLQLQQQASTLQSQNTDLKHKAARDGLTQLFNRASFDAFFAQSFQAALQRNTPLALVLLDADHFGKLNNTYGHQAGDAVLRALAQIMQGAVRQSDMAARYGGEEMVLVLPGAPRSAASAIAERVRKSIELLSVSHGGKSLKVTASLGVAYFEPPSPFRSAPQLLKAADLAVYAAKKAGRNCVRVFTLNAAKAA